MNSVFIESTEKSDVANSMHMQGGLARYINHSCEPNCETRVLKSVGGVKHIAIFSKHTIPAGAELCYDYKVPPLPLPPSCSTHRAVSFLQRRPQ